MLVNLTILHRVLPFLSAIVGHEGGNSICILKQLLKIPPWPATWVVDQDQRACSPFYGPCCPSVRHSQPWSPTRPTRLSHDDSGTTWKTSELTIPSGWSRMFASHQEALSSWRVLCDSGQLAAPSRNQPQIDRQFGCHVSDVQRPGSPRYSHLNELKKNQLLAFLPRGRRQPSPHSSLSRLTLIAKKLRGL